MQDNSYTIAQHAISHALLGMAHTTKFLMRTLQMFGHSRYAHADMTSLCLIADELDKIADRHGLGKSAGADLGSEAPAPGTPGGPGAPANTNEPTRMADNLPSEMQPESESTNNAEDQS